MTVRAEPTALPEPVVIPETEQATNELTNESTNDVTEELSGSLLEQRSIATAGWLQNLPATGYTIQLYSVSQANENLMEEFLQFLQLNGSIDQTYVCWLSGNSRRTPSWIVFYGEFAGVTPARNFINQQPQFIRQYSPYVRNLNEIGCVNDGT